MTPAARGVSPHPPTAGPSAWSSPYGQTLDSRAAMEEPASGPHDLNVGHSQKQLERGLSQRGRGLDTGCDAYSADAGGPSHPCSAANPPADPAYPEVEDASASPAGDQAACQASADGVVASHSSPAQAGHEHDAACLHASESRAQGPLRDVRHNAVETDPGRQLRPESRVSADILHVDLSRPAEAFELPQGNPRTTLHGQGGWLWPGELDSGGGQDLPDSWPARGDYGWGGPLLLGSPRGVEPPYAAAACPRWCSFACLTTLSPHSGHYPAPCLLIRTCSHPSSGQRMRLERPAKQTCADKVCSCTARQERTSLEHWVQQRL